MPPEHITAPDVQVSRTATIYNSSEARTVDRNELTALRSVDTLNTGMVPASRSMQIGFGEACSYTPARLRDRNPGTETELLVPVVTCSANSNSVMPFVTVY